LSTATLHHHFKEIHQRADLITAGGFSDGFSVLDCRTGTFGTHHGSASHSHKTT
jgi:hypothetical protein